MPWAVSSLPNLDRTTMYFLATVVFLGTLFVAFRLSFSSYGVVLNTIDAPEDGPILGSPRNIRSDEWANDTALFQVAVRNGFRRINETSPYREDLRNVLTLPIADWSLPFKPGMWAFFVADPATAFSILYAFGWCACLIGYQLLFRSFGLDSFTAILASLLIFFSGYAQFWWTSFAALIAGFPWIVLILRAPMRWGWKALLLAWMLPVVAFPYVYPALLASLAFLGAVLVLAISPSWFRSRSNWIAALVGAANCLLVLYLYFADILPVMYGTEYPGHRIATPGTVPFTAVLSQLYPFLTFQLHGYRQLVSINICEIGAVGSFLPILTLCLTRYRDVVQRPALMRALAVLGAAFALTTAWQLAPAPIWLGQLLQWTAGPPQRLLLVSGILLASACLLIWANRLIVINIPRLVLFLVIGPIGSVLLKAAIFSLRPSDLLFDVVVSAIAIGGGLALWYLPPLLRPRALLAAVVLMNVAVFGHFNPLQPTRPIFHPPETAVLRQLREAAAKAPQGLVVDPRFYGATLNGLGFRSVSHMLQSPSLEFFRAYFPAMDPVQFNRIFNRYALVILSNVPVPLSNDADAIYVPIEAFRPVAHQRTAVVEPLNFSACDHNTGGSIDRITPEPSGISIEGWAPWKSETREQGISILTSRSIARAQLRTVQRPELAERFSDYRFVKSGFHLQVTSADGLPIRPEEIVVLALGAAREPLRLHSGPCSIPELRAAGRPSAPAGNSSSTEWRAEVSRPISTPTDN